MIKTVTPLDFEFKTEPYAHQREAFMLSRDEEVFAYLMEMGTGKTKLTIDVAAWLFLQGEINFVIVSAPKGVHTNWAKTELPEHLPDWIDRRVCVWSADMKVAEWDNYWSLWDHEFKGLRILCVNHDAFSAPDRFWTTDRVIAKKVRKDRPRFGTAITKIMNGFDVLFVVDESSKIKTPGARRSRRHDTMGKRAKYRRILTGTLGGPLEAYQQFHFLDPTLLGGHPPMNYYAFKHRYAEWRRERNFTTGKSYEILTGYKNLDELQEKVAVKSFRKKKNECLDLPEKIYKRRECEMAPDQERIYAKLKHQSILELKRNVDERTVANVLTKYLRLQQVMGGWLPDPDNPEAPAKPIFKDPEENPRIISLLDFVEQNEDQRIILWARFQAEIEAITEVLNRRYGANKAVTYYGKTEADRREENIYRFQGRRAIIDPDTHQRIGWDDCPEEERAQFFVANQHAGGYGLTLTAATAVGYYSNDFSLEARLQSEDRCHRIGQHHPVLYCDFYMPGTLDARILRALKDKKNLADTVVGDDPSEWF